MKMGSSVECCEVIKPETEVTNTFWPVLTYTKFQPKVHKFPYTLARKTALQIASSLQKIDVHSEGVERVPDRSDLRLNLTSMLFFFLASRLIKQIDRQGKKHPRRQQRNPDIPSPFAFWHIRQEGQNVPQQPEQKIKLFYWWIGIAIHQYLHLCPMFTNEQEIRVTGFYGRFYLFRRPALQKQR